jgi:hypothetical protein
MEQEEKMIHVNLTEEAWQELNRHKLKGDTHSSVIIRLSNHYHQIQPKEIFNN